MLITLSDHCQQSRPNLLRYPIGTVCTLDRLLLFSLQKFFGGSSFELSQRRTAVSVALKCADFSKITNIEVDEINTDYRGMLVITLSITSPSKGVFKAEFLLDNELMIERVISRTPNNENEHDNRMLNGYYRNYIAPPLVRRDENQSTEQAVAVFRK